MAMTVERWGPYCPLPQDQSPYVHVVYPTAHGLIQDDNGEVREMTAEELEPLEERYAAELAGSFLLK